MARPLDFLIIGAQKSGTTSLFHHLRSHPRVFMPPQKEVMFFTPERNYARGWSAYARRYYRRAPADALWGKATPQYMVDPEVPGRIAATMPDIRLIAVLRNPIDRAISHHAMHAMRGYEREPFAEAIEPLVQPGAAEEACRRPADIPSEKACYLVWGEYGRILSRYRRILPDTPLLTLFLEEFHQQPRRELARIYDFLGLDAPPAPHDLGRPYLKRRSGKATTLSRVWFAALQRLLRRLPRDARSAIRFRYDLVALPFAEVPPCTPEAMASSRARLREYFRADVERLTELLGRDVPWPEFAGSTSALYHA